MNMAKSENCLDPNILTEINETYHKLKKEKLKTLEENLPGYIRKANEFRHMIDGCAK